MSEIESKQPQNQFVQNKTVVPTLNTAIVLKKKQLNASVVEIELEKPQNFTSKIGQFISIQVTNKQFRAYSLVSHPNDKTLKIAVTVGHNGLGANYLRNIAKDDHLTFIGPAGRFFMADFPAQNVLFLATGTGIAPFIPMLRELVVSKKNQICNIQLFFGERTKSELFYIEQLEAFKNMYSRFDYTICLSRENSSKFSPGHITGKYVIKDPTQTQVYICGNPTMVAENVELVKKLGVPVENIFQEKFTHAVAKL